MTTQSRQHLKDLDLAHRRRVALGETQDLLAGLADAMAHFIQRIEAKNPSIAMVLIAGRAELLSHLTSELAGMIEQNKSWIERLEAERET